MGWQARAMRWVGIALLAASLGLGIVAYGIDTSATTGAVWVDGVFQGVTESRDPSPARHRDGGLLVAGTLAVVGAALVGLGYADRGRLPG